MGPETLTESGEGEFDRNESIKKIISKLNCSDADGVSRFLALISEGRIGFFDNLFLKNTEDEPNILPLETFLFDGFDGVMHYLKEHPSTLIPESDGLKDPNAKFYLQLDDKKLRGQIINSLEALLKDSRITEQEIVMMESDLDLEELSSCLM